MTDSFCDDFEGIQAVCRVVERARGSFGYRQFVGHRSAVPQGRSKPVLQRPMVLANQRGMAIDSKGYVYLSANTKIYRINPDGSGGIVFAGGDNSGNANGSGTAAQFNGICGLAFDTNDNPDQTDVQRRVLFPVRPALMEMCSGQTLTKGGNTNGTLQEALLSVVQAGSMAVDRQGNIYFVEDFLGQIRKVTLR